MIIIDTPYSNNMPLIDMTIRVSSVKMGIYQYQLLLSALLFSSSLEQVSLLFLTALLALDQSDWMPSYQNVSKFNTTAHLD